MDRAEGRFLYARPFVSRITWAKGLDREGKPTPGAVPGGSAETLCPGALSGGKSWNQTAYSPKLDYLFIPAGDVCDDVKQADVNPTPKASDLHMGGQPEKWSSGGGTLTAFDVKTGEPKWQYKSPYPMRSSVLATAGGLLFTGDLESNVLAFDARDGRQLWKFAAGSMPQNSMTYAVDGKQYVAVAVGWGQVLANSCRPTRRSSLRFLAAACCSSSGCRTKVWRHLAAGLAGAGGSRRRNAAVTSTRCSRPFTCC